MRENIPLYTEKEKHQENLLHFSLLQLASNMVYYSLCILYTKRVTWGFLHVLVWILQLVSQFLSQWLWCNESCLSHVLTSWHCPRSHVWSCTISSSRQQPCPSAVQTALKLAGRGMFLHFHPSVQLMTVTFLTKKVHRKRNWNTL